MATFTIQPTIVDAEIVEMWKKEWLLFWDLRNKSKLRTGSCWVVVDEPLIPLCPFHFKDCYMDESLRHVRDWRH